MDVRQPIISEISRRKKYKLLTEHLEPFYSILEVGSGTDWLSNRLVQNGFSNVTTLDINNTGADIVGDINKWRELQIGENSFDVVIALEVIEHVDCLSSLCSICKRDGLIMLSSPHPKWDWLMKFLELIKLLQKRTSPHSNLTDFNKISLNRVVLKRPFLIHQVAIFKNHNVCQ
jgi:2-polyprenyl-3-methyl-5-hydroxy-6-metoxy-1,4-benzoquinol methylase